MILAGNKKQHLVNKSCLETAEILF